MMTPSGRSLDLSLAGALASPDWARLPAASRGVWWPRLLHPFSAFGHIVDDEADVVNAAEIFPLLSNVWIIALLAGPDGQFRSPSLR